MSQKCLVCELVFTQKERFIRHLDKLHKLTLTEYGEQYLEPKKEIIDTPAEENDIEVEETPRKEIILPKDMKEATFGNEKDAALQSPLFDFLRKYGVTIDDAVALFLSYKNGTPLPVRLKTDYEYNIASAAVRELKTQERVETTHLATAELLVKEQGYKCVEVRGKKGNVPKTWVLIKKR